MKIETTPEFLNKLTTENAKLRAELAAERERVKVLENELDLREQDDCNEENYLQSQVDALRAELAAEQAAHKDTKETAVAFLAVWAAQYQRDYKLDGLHPQHYDMLKKLGARMDDFKRARIDAALAKGDWDES